MRSFKTIDFGDEVTIFDISDPQIFHKLGRSQHSGVIDMTGVVADNRELFAINGVNSSATGRLTVYDLSDPGNVSVLDSTGLGLDNPRAISIQQDHAYIVDRDTNELLIFDVSDPTNITSKDSISTLPYQAPDVLCVSGNYAYVSNETVLRLRYQKSPTN